ncbi:SDR family oxidoreductase [Trujillonella endophytica]|uniref:NAD(P)-dependent dehydrogenase, short-chain alcohol dehydrogenase family n=1 Tax=Trujillonella endophytica TaxID=673521 RepID=A0A1H8T6I8_9ACTN|nr:SDR family oxidoreductase [Trujillella endophytica]SEO86346.1 NAD(P)-dependent dehydrogenase, short-chain alcohol dehydrogenase family [Trujillella endophytica]
MGETRRVAVVGAASGIGADLLARWVERGDEVHVLDHVAVGGADAASIACDLRDPASIESAVRALPDGLDAVAHVAGVPGTRPADDVLAVNFLGMRHLVELVLPKVVPGGAVTVVASTAGGAWRARLPALEPLLATDSVAAGLAWLSDTPAGYPVYNLSKEAAIAFVARRSVAAWREGRVRLNTVSPGPVETPILGDFEQSMGKDVLDGVRAAVGRHATTADVVPVIDAVCGAGFGWVIGQDVQVDAGFMAGLASGATVLAGR